MASLRLDHRALNMTPDVPIGSHRLCDVLSGGGLKSSDEEDWIEEALTGCRFPDARFGDHLRRLLEGVAGAVGGSLLMACQDWANAKAAYRFFDNAPVSEGRSWRVVFRRQLTVLR